MNKIQLALVDDHQMITDGLRHQIAQEEDMELVFTALHGADFLKQLQEHREVQVAILDFDMPQMNGLEVVRHLKTLLNPPQVIIVSMHKQAQLVKELHAEGIRGYILKEQGMQEVVKGIRRVANRETYWGEGVAELLLKGAQAENDAGFAVQLTERELDVLKLLPSGISSKKIGEQLHLAASTVDTHRRNMLAKFEVENTIQLVMAAQRAGILK
ncbi:MAG TPA: hypothetical protein DCR93_20465 [Cytophagales bacterium]|nr:hypothetical protein [Cytophagales bacterium]HAP61767.1 hypothetical protein [Cytophagales bacterium]